MSAVSDRVRALVEPSATAVLTMELQRGVVGDQALFPALVERVHEIGMLERVGALCAAARDAGAHVVHCTVRHRADGAGRVANCKVFAMNEKLAAAGENPVTDGQPGADLVDELSVAESDIEVARMHGMSPFTSTSLDQVLRNLGIRTIVATGVSVNLGVFGMVMSAVDLGYQVVVPTDGVAGVPADYADAVVEQSLSLLATLSTTDEVIAALNG